MSHQGSCAVCGVEAELHAPPELNGICAPCHMAALERVVPMTDQISAWSAANPLALPLQHSFTPLEHAARVELDPDLARLIVGSESPCGDRSLAGVVAPLLEERRRHFALDAWPMLQAQVWRARAIADYERQAALHMRPLWIYPMPAPPRYWARRRAYWQRKANRLDARKPRVLSWVGR